jgi:hypothetical protein
MAEVTWYVLDKLDIFLNFLKRGKKKIADSYFDNVSSWSAEVWNRKVYLFG